MTSLKWDPNEVLQHFDTLPIEGEHGLSYQFTAERTPLRLQLTIWQYDADVEIALWADPFSLPIIRHRLQRCLRIRSGREKSGEFIDFFAPDESASHHDGNSTLIHGTRLWMEPQIRIDFID